MSHRRSIIRSLIVTLALIAAALGAAPPAAQAATPAKDGVIVHLYVAFVYDSGSYSSKESFMPRDSLDQVVQDVSQYWSTRTNGAVERVTYDWEAIPAPIKLNGEIPRIAAADAYRSAFPDLPASTSMDAYFLDNGQGDIIVAIQPGSDKTSNIEGSGSGGPGFLHGGYITAYTNTSSRNWAHELGHVFGLTHASTASCPTSGGVTNDSNLTACSNEAYGDTMDIMGGGPTDLVGAKTGLVGAAAQLSAYNRWLLGLLTEGAGVIVLDQAGHSDQTINLLSPATTARQELRIVDPNTSAIYSVEYRPGATADAAGIAVHRVDPYPNSSGNQSPIGIPLLASGLGKGQSFTSAGGKVKITVTSVGPAAATVAVDIATPATARTSVPLRELQTVTVSAAGGLVAIPGHTGDISNAESYAWWATSSGVAADQRGLQVAPNPTGVARSITLSTGAWISGRFGSIQVTLTQSAGTGPVPVTLKAQADVTTLAHAGGQGLASVTLTTTATSWTATTSSWLHLSATSGGSGSTTLTVSADASDSIVDRYGTIRFTGGGKTDTVILTQTGDDCADSEATACVVALGSPFSGSLDTKPTTDPPTYDKDWISFTAWAAGNYTIRIADLDGFLAVNTNLVYLYTPTGPVKLAEEGSGATWGMVGTANLAAGATAYVEVPAWKQTKFPDTYTVTVDGPTALLIEPSTPALIPTSGGSTSVTVRTNIADGWTLTPEEDCDWLQTSPTTGPQGASVVTFTSNKTGIHDCKITVKAGTKTTSFYVDQANDDFNHLLKVILRWLREFVQQLIAILKR